MSNTDNNSAAAKVSPGKTWDAIYGAVKPAADKAKLDVTAYVTKTGADAVVKGLPENVQADLATLAGKSEKNAKTAAEYLAANFLVKRPGVALFPELYSALKDAAEKAGEGVETYIVHQMAKLHNISFTATAAPSSRGLGLKAAEQRAVIETAKAEMGDTFDLLLELSRAKAALKAAQDAEGKAADDKAKADAAKAVADATATLDAAKAKLAAAMAAA